MRKVQRRGKATKSDVPQLPQPAPNLYILIDKDGDALRPNHKMKDAFDEKRAFNDAGVGGLRIFEYAPIKEVK